MEATYCIDCGNQLTAIEADFGHMLGANICVNCAKSRLTRIGVK
jgi:hypothetical protein